MAMPNDTSASRGSKMARVPVRAPTHPLMSIPERCKPGNRAPLRRALALTCGLAVLTSASIAATPKVFDVRTFGARGDGKTLDTTSIQEALDAAGKAGGAVVRFRPGTYLSKPIYLPTRTTVLLDKGATLKATDDPKDYLPPDVSWDDILEGRSRGPFIHFVNGKDLTDV